jgi:non-ribosomal peptide synthetase component F
LRITWNTPPHRPLDLNGPVSLPYERFDPSWLDCPILDLYGGLAARHPERIAIDDGLLRLTCGELWALACRLGRTIAQSVPHFGPIAVLLPHGATYWAGVLGGFAAGRTCVLLDRDGLPGRNAEIIANAHVAAVITDAEGARRHSAWTSGLPLILVESALIGAAEEHSAVLGPDDPAFILYTSGSVGRPKGIVQSQRNVLDRLMHFIDAAHLSENDRVAIAGAAATFGMVNKGALSALLSGARLYPVDVRRMSLGALAGMIRDQRITVLQATPSLLRVLTQLNGARDFLGSVRLVRTAGEPLLQADLERLRRRLPGECLILHVFAATEAALAQWFVPPDDARDPVRVAAGYPPPWCQTAVLDEMGRCCGPGETGELVLRSRYVALGEWQNGRLVPGRMPPDPEEPSFRIYHTGDLVRQGVDGVVLVVGRKDRQLKIRGQRVEPIEVEGVLRHSADVLEAVVLPRQEGEDIRLVAFVVPSGENNAKLVDSLRAMLEGSLPAHMQPSRIILVDAMPLLPGGKIDAHALLARHAARLHRLRQLKRKVKACRPRALRQWCRGLGDTLWIAPRLRESNGSMRPAAIR